MRYAKFPMVLFAAAAIDVKPIIVDTPKFETLQRAIQVAESLLIQVKAQSTPQMRRKFSGQKTMSRSASNQKMAKAESKRFRLQKPTPIQKDSRFS